MSTRRVARVDRLTDPGPAALGVGSTIEEVLVLIGVAFVAGLITAISPCVLPVLPIILAGGVTGQSRARPFAIIAGLVASFTVFTVAGASLLDALGLPQDFLRNAAIVLLLVLAATLLVPRLALVLERPLLFLSRRRPGTERNGFVLGLGLGLVFVPCAGPVLAAVTALAASGRIGVRTFAVTGAYALGAAVPMLLVALGGQRLAGSVKLMRTHAGATRRVAGALLGATALAIAFGADQRFTTALPGYTQRLQDAVERTDAAGSRLRGLASDNEALAAAARDEQPLEFRGISLWLNTAGGKPLSLAKLRGKVVLVDFWTYSCINCLRTLPHLKAWDAAYRKDGLVIVGVHSPEFAFERVPSNVRSAVRRLGVRYPVALDNAFATWNAYHNQYWPAEYLIDRGGELRRTHFGEGDYDESESAIRRLLGEGVRKRRTSVADATPHIVTTPESYLGYARLDRFEGLPIVRNRLSTYRFPPRLGRDELSYAGTWRVGESHITAGRNARLRLDFGARRIHLVLGGRGTLGVRVDGKPVRTVGISGIPRLYTLETFPRPREGLLELRFSPGVEAYAFTFG
ncbi:MAG: cytochrome c biogenesis protein DipZ [Actinobacteria bacterium]|nr:cytochrome c biogenesis protein DipZ [Actinomycetota bacterium]